VSALAGTAACLAGVLALFTAEWLWIRPDPGWAAWMSGSTLTVLAGLPPRQRAVIVLRYWEQRTEAETAALLGCSEGTVKSAASRGLQRLRELAVSPANSEVTEKNS